LKLQGRHVAICKRIAVKMNMACGRFQVSEEILQWMLDRNPVDKANLEEKMKECKKERRQNGKRAEKRFCWKTLEGMKDGSKALKCEYGCGAVYREDGVQKCVVGEGCVCCGIGFLQRE